MSRFLPEPPHRHGTAATTAIVIANLGTPEAPTAPALRRYLKQFLSDPRVVEIPRLIWWLIRFYPPDRVDRKKIWGVMAAQFGLTLAPELHERLPDIFPAASGRDIKGLAKLVAKYCSQKKLTPTEEVFRRCSMFRAMDQASV